MEAGDRLTDEALLELISRGDAAARSAFADCYLKPVHDFALRVSLDSGLAAAASLAAFGRLATEAEQRPPRLPPRSWLLALVHEEALARMRRGGRAGAAPDEEPELVPPLDERFLQPSVDASDGGDAGHLRLAWQAARAQRPRDYALLDLTLRRGLAPEEIAKITALSRSSAYTTLGRLRGALEEAFAAALLYEAGREACPELTELVARSAELDPALRREVTRHAEGCPICGRTGADYPLAGELFASLADVEPPTDLLERAAGTLAGSEVADGETEAQVGLPFEALALAETRAEDEPEAEDAPELADEQEPEDEFEADEALLPEAEELEADSARDALEAEEEEPLAEAEEEEPPGEYTAEAEPAAAAAEASDVGDWPFRPEPAAFPASGGASPPPRAAAPFAFGGDDGGSGGSRRKLFAIVGVLTIALVLVGVVLGDRIGGGGDDNGGGAAGLATGTPGVGQIACGSSPTIDQGVRATLSFESADLAGFTISDVGVRAISENVGAQSLGATVEGNLTVVLDAFPVPGAAGGTAEYRLDVEFAREQEKVQSECTVLVRAPAEATMTPADDTPVPTETPAPGGRTYTVVAGDFLSTICERERPPELSVDECVAEVVRLNGLASPNAITIGAELLLP